MHALVLRIFMQSKHLSKISQYFAMPTLSGFRSSLRATLTDLLETDEASITENDVTFIQSVVILERNCR